jgi:hypothetical protein
LIAAFVPASVNVFAATELATVNDPVPLLAKVSVFKVNGPMLLVAVYDVLPVASNSSCAVGPDVGAGPAPPFQLVASLQLPLVVLLQMLWARDDGASSAKAKQEYETTPLNALGNLISGSSS